MVLQPQSIRINMWFVLFWGDNFRQSPVFFLLLLLMCFAAVNLNRTNNTTVVIGLLEVCTILFPFTFLIFSVIKVKAQTTIWKKNQAAFISTLSNFSIVPVTVQFIYSNNVCLIPCFQSCWWIFDQGVELNGSAKLLPYCLTDNHKRERQFATTERFRISLSCV